MAWGTCCVVRAK